MLLYRISAVRAASLGSKVALHARLTKGVPTLKQQGGTLACIEHSRANSTLKRHGEAAMTPASNFLLGPAVKVLYVFVRTSRRGLELQGSAFAQGLSTILCCLHLESNRCSESRCLSTGTLSASVCSPSLDLIVK